MKNNLYKAALLAALGIAGTTAAQAQSLGGDMGVGFNDLAGPGSAHNDYVLDLGSAAQFTTTSTASFTINSTLFNDAFSTDASALNDVAVGAAAGLGGVGGFMYVTGLQPTTTSASLVDNAVSSLGGTTTLEYSSGASSPTDPWSSVVAQSPSLGGYTSQVTPVSDVSNPMSYLSSGDATLTLWEATIGGTTRTPTLSAWTEVGTFTIDANSGESDPNADTISYNGVDSVPEPGTYGLFAGGGLLLLAFRRRFSAKNV